MAAPSTLERAITPRTRAIIFNNPEILDPDKKSPGEAAHGSDSKENAAEFGYDAAARQLTPYTSTQEQAWMVLAARALGRETGNALNVAGETRKGPYYRRVRAEGNARAGRARGGSSDRGPGGRGRRGPRR